MMMFTSMTTALLTEIFLQGSDHKTQHDTSVRYSVLGLIPFYPQFDCSSGTNFSVVLGRSAFIHRQRLRWNYWYIFPSSPQAWELGQWGLLIEPIINVWRTVKGACFTLNSSDTHCAAQGLRKDLVHLRLQLLKWYQTFFQWKKIWDQH